LNEGSHFFRSFCQLFGKLCNVASGTLHLLVIQSFISFAVTMAIVELVLCRKLRIRNLPNDDIDGIEHGCTKLAAQPTYLGKWPLLQRDSLRFGAEIGLVSAKTS
jgi:hypothetical protein